TLRFTAIPGNPFELSHEFLGKIRLIREFFFSKEPCLDAHCELNLFGSIQQRNLTDLLEVILHWICGCARDCRRDCWDIYLVRGFEYDRSSWERLHRFRLTRLFGFFVISFCLVN